jgi:hypothetical protein
MTMHLRNNNRVLLLTVAMLALFCIGPVLENTAAQSREIPGGDPVAGPIEVFTDAAVVNSPLGTLVDTTLVVENSGRFPARVFLIGELRWPDGSRQLLHYGPPVVIAPSGAVIISALSVVPDTVGSGEGLFTVTAIVGAIGPGGHGAYGGRLIASDNSPFELP